MNKSRFNQIAEVARRDFLRGLLGAGSAIVFAPRKLLAETKRRFVLYIHCGSWDGLSAGLIQPPDATKWPRGVFHVGSDAISNNPLVNQHVKAGVHVLHGYSAALAELQGSLAWGIANAQTVNHAEAHFLQATGGKAVSSNPSWAAGFAQANLGESGQALIVGNPGASSKTSATTPAVGVMGSSDMSQFNARFIDVGRIDKGEFADAYWAVLKDLNANASVAASFVPDGFRKAVNTYLTNLTQSTFPIPDSVQQAVASAINATVVNKIIDDHNGVNDGPGIKSLATIDNQLSFDRQALLNQVQLAAALATTGTASGMAIQLAGQDLHFGGSAVYTARSAAQVFAHVVAFWRYIVKENMQNDVMVIISHEFSRTAYNFRAAPDFEITTKNGPVKVVCPAEDHQPVCGIYVVNGNLKASQGLRIGVLTDGYGAAPSDDATGLSAVAGSAYTSVDVIGSLLMRCFPDAFKDERVVSKIWPSFRKPISYVV